MKKLIFCFFSLIISAGKCQEIDSLWVASHYTKQEMLIPMRDGIKLFTYVYTPIDQTDKHPMLMVRTPYSIAPYGRGFSQRLYQTHWAQYIKENYIIVMQDVRGTFMSEGEFIDIRPHNVKKKKTETDESSDTYDAIEYLIKNVPNNNGNVGIFGISYPGYYATMAALCNHPALKAVSPQAPVTEWFLGDDFHHNGAFALHDAFSFYSGFGRPRRGPSEARKAGYKIPGADNYNWFLKTGAVKNFTALLGDSIQFWKDLVAHPNYDEWWKARDTRRSSFNIKPAILVVGGTFDAEDCYGAWNLYKAIEKQNPATNNKLVMGPWFHGGWHRSDGDHLGNVRFGSKTSLHFQKDIEMAFFDFFLRGKGSAESVAEANIFFSGENNWKTFSSWPPKEIQNTPIFLKENQKLSFDKPSAANAFDKYISDPSKPVPYTEDVHTGRTREYMDDDQRFAARRPDVLVYETEILQEDLTLAGPVIADLRVVLSSTDADFVVKIIDVFPDDFVYEKDYCCAGPKPEAEMKGYQMLVRGEIFRGRYRESFENPKAFEAGKMSTVKFDLPDVAHTFKKGHKLMVQVQSSWFPLFDRNPQQFVNIYTCSDSDFVSEEVKIFHQADAPSNIILPVLKK